jgi:hypothetical protein
VKIHSAFNKYMDRYFEYKGQWDCPSKCGLLIAQRKDGKVVVIATEIYRENPGTPVTEWCANLATQIIQSLTCKPENFIFIEHTPDLKSKLTFYGETFDLVNFDWTGERFETPKWERLSSSQVDAMLEQ